MQKTKKDRRIYFFVNPKNIWEFEKMFGETYEEAKNLLKELNIETFDNLEDIKGKIEESKTDFENIYIGLGCKKLLEHIDWFNHTIVDEGNELWKVAPVIQYITDINLREVLISK